MARVQSQHGPEKNVCSLSVFLARHWALFGLFKLFANQGDQSVSTKFRIACCSCFAPCFAHCSCVAPCCHDPFIVRSASNLSTVPWLPSVCASVSMFTINTDHCLFLFLFLCWCLRLYIGFLCIYRGLCVRVGSVCTSWGCSLLPDPSYASLGFILWWSVGPMVLQNTHLCNLNNIAVLKQRLASFQHLRNSSPS